MNQRKFGFTRNRIRNLPTPEMSRIFYTDTQTRGLQIAITPSNVKTFSYFGRLNGKPKRVTIGRFDDMAISDARSKANQFRTMLSDGIDPNKLKKAQTDAQITLKQCLEDYLTVHSHLSPNTSSQYTREVKRYFARWYEKPLANINRTMVAKRHREISQRVPPTANRVMRVLRALFNFANQEYEDANGKGLFPDNPVSRLSHQRLWNKEVRRTGMIQRHDLKAWLEATDKLPEYSKHGAVLRDYLQLVLFTGLRRTEALKLEWANIDFKARTLKVPKTKNGKPHLLPLSDFLIDLLKRRYQSRINEYVFAGCYGNEHLIEPKKGITKVKELTGIEFTLHDLRRTFITIAESLDISMYAVKHLVNHSMSNDVTAGYIMWDVERIRIPMQDITNYITKTAELKESAAIITLPMRKQQ